VSRRTIVVGGGMAGMTCALSLAAAGAEVVLVEAAPRLGGRWSTCGRFEVTHHGRDWSFPVEHGLHGVWRQYQNLRRLLDTHGLSGHFAPAGEQSLAFTDAQGRAQTAGIGLPVRESRLPDSLAQLAIFAHPGLRAATLSEGPLAALRAAWDLSHSYAFVSARDARGDTHTPPYDAVPVADFIAEWPPVLQRMFNALTHSAFFREPTEVSLAAFLTGLEIYVVRDKRNSGFDVALQDPETTVFGPLAQALRGAGGEIRLGAPVRSLRIDGGRVTGVVLADDTVLAGDAVALALDPPGFQRLGAAEALGVELDAAALGAPSVVVRLLFDRALGLRPDRPTSGVFADGELDNFFWLDRLQTPFAEWARETGGSALECHLYGRRAAWATQATDAELLARIEPTLHAHWPNLVGRRVAAHVQRNAPTHTTFPPGTFSRLPGVGTRLGNVALCGDWIAVPDCALYLERATVTGLMAARALAPALSLDPGWMPAPLRVDPPRPSIRVAQVLFRALRGRGLLPDVRRY
jgi:isorenieratene synthase